VTRRLAILSVAAGLAAMAAIDGAAAPAVHPVAIEAFEFRPPVVTVKQGESVEWRNGDPLPHTVTAQDAGLDSGEIPANGVFRFTAARKGRFVYRCTLHSTMSGELVVE
jgi:plastocyanin